MIILASFNLHPQKWTYGFKKIPSNKPRIETILPGQARKQQEKGRAADALVPRIRSVSFLITTRSSDHFLFPPFRFLSSMV